MVVKSLKTNKKTAFISVGIILLIISTCSLIVAIYESTRVIYLQNNPLPNWNSIIPSKSTRADTLKILGPPTREWGCDLGEVRRNWATLRVKCIPGMAHLGYQNDMILPKYNFAYHEIHIDTNDRVSYIVETNYAYPMEVNKSIDNYVADFGPPEKVIYSLRGGFDNALLYCERGIILHANPDAGISRTVYFAPMTTESCIRYFVTEISVTIPDPTLHIRPELDPWGFSNP